MLLLTLIIISFLSYIVHNLNVCRDNCNDEGCAYTDKQGTYKGCDCWPSNGSHIGNECEIIKDICYKNTHYFNTCSVNGKCKSYYGIKYCHCNVNRTGDYCALKTGGVEYPRILSLIFRKKVRPGELTFVYLVVERPYPTNYLTAFRYFNLQTKMINPSKIEMNFMTTDQFYIKCMNMGNKYFSMNKNKCNDIKIVYDKYPKIAVYEFSSYHTVKPLQSNSIGHYFGDDESEGRMGYQYSMQAQISSLAFNHQILALNYSHFVVDDETSYCLPFIVPGKNCSTNGFDVNFGIFRNQDLFIKMDVSNDTETCHKYIPYAYEWTFYNAVLDDETRNFDRITIDLEEKIIHGRDLIVPRYVFPQLEQLQAMINVTLVNEENDSEKYSTNYYSCILEISLVGLYAEIVGDLVREVSDSTLVTLDASLSYNPNEPNSRQGDINYVWECNVREDVENCKKFVTADPIRQLTAFLNKSEKYVFKLKTEVNDDYVKRVGRPDEGYANVTLLPRSTLTDRISIKCKKNCEYRSNPLHVIYLSVETSCKSCTFEWYYQKRSDSVSGYISAKTISTPNTPSHICIVMRSMLDYNTTYMFKVKDKDSDLMSYLVIRTIPQQIAGECHVHPDSGIAGITLFTITCSNFQNAYYDNNLKYYLYEEYEIDQLFGEVIIGETSNNKFQKIKLSNHGKLKIIAYNEFGTYASINISVKIVKCNTNELTKIFKRMKIDLLSNNIFDTIQLLSIVSDAILYTNTIDHFSILLNTLSKIPNSGHSILRIEKIVSVLKKIVIMHSVYNNTEIISNNVLEISKNVLRMTRYLFEYLKNLLYNDTITEVERIEKTYNNLQSIIDTLIYDIDPVIHINHKISNSMRYFWSTFENTALVIRNIDETLKIFGESILLHQFLFEHPKIYENIQNTKVKSYFWANMLSGDDMQNEINAKNIISISLANEIILSNKNAMWGLKIFELDKHVDRQNKSIGHSMNVKSSLKYVALSVHDKFNGKYIESINKFVSPASITFNIDETVDEIYKTYSIYIPVAGSNDIDYDKAILVFRFDATKVGSIFAIIKNSSHDLLVSWTRNQRPDFQLMKDDQYVTNIPAGHDCNLTFQTQKDHQNDIYYIGVFIDVANNNALNISYRVDFSMNMVSMQCAYWNSDTWSSEGMEIGLDSSVEGNVQCYTYHFSTFRSSIFVTPNLVHPLDEIHLFSTITNNPVCLILVIIIFIIYICLLYWSSIRDLEDIVMGRINILDDNYVGEDEVYLVTIYTGHGLGSGTTANVCIELNGTNTKSRAHWLYSRYYQALQRSNDDWFIIFTPQSLGELQSIHVWHDNFGSDPDWYCTRIIVKDIRKNKMWIIEVERWFSLHRSTENIEYTINVTDLKHNWRKETKEYVGTEIREKHLWASVFVRHPRSPITRCQRLSVIVCAILYIMLCSMMFYKTVHTNEEEFTKFEFKLREFMVILQSTIVEMIVTFCVYLCFERGRRIQLNKFLHTRPQKKQKKRKKNSEVNGFSNVFNYISKYVDDKSVYYPVCTETIAERYQWNRWFILGWACCIITYIFAAFFIILYGLKFGQIKSLCWLTVVTMAIFQGIIFSKPLKILLISGFVAKFNQKNMDQTITYTYYLLLDRYRDKTKMLLHNVEYTRTIRINRRRYLYTPFTGGVSIDILRKRRKHMAKRNNIKLNIVICTVLLLTAMSFLYFLNVFSHQNDKYQENKIVAKYLKHTFTSKNKLITLDNLKLLLSYKLIKSLHSLELYNGISITKDTVEIVEHTRVGWFGLYSSRLIGGGVRLRQKRVHLNGTDDNGIYGPGWSEYNTQTNNTSWMYSKLQTKNFLFFKNSTVGDTGYELHLTGGLLKCISTLDKHLILNWLDTKTRCLFVEFQIYTPNTDSVTVVKIKMTTSCGLLYKISTDEIVHTVPMSSVAVEWITYAFTIVATCSLIAVTVTCTLLCVFNRPEHNGHYRWTLTAASYDGLLAALVVVMIVAMRQRLVVMEKMTNEVVPATSGYIDLTPACHMHTICTSCAGTLAVAALLKFLQPWWPDVGDTSLATAVSVAVVVTGGFLVHARLSALLSFAGGPILLLLHAVVFSLWGSFFVSNLFSGRYTPSR